jgi:uncharacterized membrane protein YoaK (UPF0700 family)
MQENFLVSVPHFKPTRNTVLTIIALIISVAIVIPLIGFRNEMAIFVVFILAIIIFMLLVNANSNNMPNAIPSTVYPVPPHLGLNGISLNNLVAGVDNVKY